MHIVFSIKQAFYFEKHFKLHHLFAGAYDKVVCFRRREWETTKDAEEQQESA